MKITRLKWLCVIAGSVGVSAYAVTSMVSDEQTAQRSGTKLADITCALSSLWLVSNQLEPGCPHPGDRPEGRPAPKDISEKGAPCDFTPKAVYTYDDYNVNPVYAYYYWVRAKTETLVSPMNYVGMGYASLSPEQATGTADIAVSDLVFLPVNITNASHPGTVRIKTSGVNSPGRSLNDCDGDGKADLAVYHQDTGIREGLPSTRGYQKISGRFGGAEYTPVTE